MKPFCRRLAVCAAVLALAPVTGGALARDRPAAFDPLAAYGPEIVFDVFRKNERIGSHRVTFSRDGDVLVAESRFAIEVTVLGLPVYRYTYTSTGRWRDGRLERLDARTDDDGTVSDVTAVHENGSLRVLAADRQSVAPAGIFPTTHWNPGVIGAAQVLNTISGHINSVRMEATGTDAAVVGAPGRPARHYVYTGDLETEVWYDKQGRWVKMRFAGKDGVPIEYRCRICGGTAPGNFETDAGGEQGML